MTLTTFVGVSVFAESRPAKETRGREAGGRIEVRGDRAERNRSAAGRVERKPARSTENRNNGSVAPRNSSSRSRSATPPRSSVSSRDRSSRDSSSFSNRDRDRTPSRDRNYGNRNDNRSRRNDNNGSWRNDSRYRSNSRYGQRYEGRSRFQHSGRVHRVYPYSGGYRVWLTGCNYPFYIPSSYYHRDRFRVGLTISLGGFYNSRGYYEYYDDRYDGRYVGNTSRGELRGVVESVDYRRETFVVRNDATGSFVTIIMRDRGRDPVRAGDFVELRGDWTRDGVFEAYAVDIVDFAQR